MNIFKKIKTSIPFLGKKSVPSVTAAPELTMGEREDRIYNKDRLKLQKLYEYWSCKEKWLLYKEGIPLLFGIEPGVKESIDVELSNKIESLWLHAQDCVSKNMLSIINTEKDNTEWEVKPVDLYCWATVSRLSMPEEFSALMAFVTQTVKSPEISPSYETNGEINSQYQRHREIVLGAATSLLVNAAQLCKNNQDQISSSLIAKQIIENENQWFGDEKSLLAESAITELLNEYIKLGNPVV